jgi:Nif-specific regulatory protein
VDLRYKPERDFDSSVKFFGVVATMIAQAVKIQRLIEEDKRRLVDENEHLRQELREKYDFSNIIGTSGPVRQVYEQVAQVAATNTTALIRGESGTGKELIAHAIHYNSLRAKKPFVKVSCAALPESLIEAELFGHEKGAFTGAEARKKGRFELAEGGTLFLDEIGDINLSTQVKLLRVLQEREFERVGGTETIKVNVRLIAATNKDMEQALANGTFREDLYYRLNVFAIELPPLRVRKDDLSLLIQSFLAEFNERNNKSVSALDSAAMRILEQYNWPGNVREVRNIIERAVILSAGEFIEPKQLPPLVTESPDVVKPTLSLVPGTTVEEAERRLILMTLEHTRDNKTRAAEILGISLKTLHNKLNKLRGRVPGKRQEEEIVSQS